MVRTPPSASDAAAMIREWYAGGLKAVDPRLAVARSIDRVGNHLTLVSRDHDVMIGGRILAVAIGKAACDMAHGLADGLGAGISRGIVLTKDGHATNPPPGWEVFEAAHPVPDERGVAATRKILSELETLTDRDLAIVLVSGGGSALLEAPRVGLSLRDIQETTRLMLNVGAPIHHLNAVRVELSQVKGGGLRRAVGNAACFSLILSDVLGNDPSVIASGPTTARRPDPNGAFEQLVAYELVDRAPRAVLDFLRSGSEPEPAPDFSRDAFLIIGDNNAFIDEIEAQAELSGLRSVIAMRGAEGEAKALATRLIETIATQQDDVDAVIGGGEATVTVRGNGRGGRNTEFALAAAIELQERNLDWVVASLASDGQDGSIDAAGAIVDRYTVDRAGRQGLLARDHLLANNSGEYFESLGALVEPGPTGTNVNDVYIAVRVVALPPED